MTLTPTSDRGIKLKSLDRNKCWTHRQRNLSFMPLSLVGVEGIKFYLCLCVQLLFLPNNLSFMPLSLVGVEGITKAGHTDRGKT
jgi:hypothetical protein